MWRLLALIFSDVFIEGLCGVFRFHILLLFQMHSARNNLNFLLAERRVLKWINLILIHDKIITLLVLEYEYVIRRLIIGTKLWGLLLMQWVGLNKIKLDWIIDGSNFATEWRYRRALLLQQTASLRQLSQGLFQIMYLLLFVFLEDGMFGLKALDYAKRRYIAGTIIQKFNFFAHVGCIMLLLFLIIRIKFSRLLRLHLNFGLIGYTTLGNHLQIQRTRHFIDWLHSLSNVGGNRWI